VLAAPILLYKKYNTVLHCKILLCCTTIMYYNTLLYCAAIYYNILLYCTTALYYTAIYYCTVLATHKLVGEAIASMSLHKEHCMLRYARAGELSTDKRWHYDRRRTH
jgi:hypothetical protein